MKRYASVFRFKSRCFKNRPKLVSIRNAALLIYSLSKHLRRMIVQEVNLQIKQSVKQLRVLAAVAPLAAVSGSADTLFVVTRAVASFIKVAHRCMSCEEQCARTLIFGSCHASPCGCTLARNLELSQSPAYHPSSRLLPPI